MNNWIYHLKDYAKENNMSYADAVKDPESRRQYYDNLGKKQPKKVKKIMKVDKELLEPIKEKIKKIKTEIKDKLKKVKTIKGKVMIKKSVVPDMSGYLSTFSA